VTDLASRLARRIAAGGPITIADYMAAALADPTQGYYRRSFDGDEGPLGAKGDFVTAPEISQLFGELIGAWLIDCWDRLGRPSPLNLVELGPGRGVLMADALRVGRRHPDWMSAIRLHLVEINPSLRSRQAERLAAWMPVWHETLADLPDGPTLLVANEFLDAMPIRQLVRHAGAWRERLVGLGPDGGFRFVLAQGPSPLGLLVPQGLSQAPEGSVFELSPAAIRIVDEVARRIVREGGAALLIDYGRTDAELGDTLQAVLGHRKTAVLENPGRADLSAHVDFSALRRVALEIGAATFGPISQGQFLTTLGIGLRAELLKAGKPGDQADAVDAGMARLVEPAQMGELFKVLVVAGPSASVAGFASPV
jgi:NADH dehydrogenase [ubiquinone] 1 alpha subcomplex assembly factor 7